MSDARTPAELDFERRALEILEASFDLDGAARDAFVSRACAGDEGLARRVWRMIGYSEHDGGAVHTGARGWLFDDAVIPERIGHFRIVREIGRGGMGVVLEGVRDDGLFDQRVAIKLVRGNVSAFDAAERFAMERRILARLESPGIARIIDGGSHDGQPWLAMELIDGGSITGHAQDLGAALPERLRLFRAACEALRFAHTRLVVHGDIKPSNIMVERSGAVKLVDFGIARLIGEAAGEGGKSEGVTRGYAAPERRAGGAPSVAADVFGLGAVLHELLTGQVPGADAVALRPSAVAGRPGAGAGAGTAPKRIAGDLDAIVGRATAEDPADRYPDVAALIDDLDRYEGHRPVAARSAGTMLRAAKFVRRHALGFSVTALVTAVLAVTTIVSTIQYRRAEAARAEADRRFVEVRDVSRFMLFDLYDRLADVPGTVEARLRLAAAAQRYFDRLDALPDAPDDVRFDTARGYRRLAIVQGVPGGASIGRPDLATASLARADTLLRQLLTERPGDADLLAELGWVTANRWTLLPDGDAARAANAQARRYFDAALAKRPALVSAQLGRLTTVKDEAYDLIWSTDHPADALPLLRRALDELRTLEVPLDRAEDVAALEAQLLARLGDATYYAGDIPGSLVPYRASEAIIRRQLARRRSLVWLNRLGEAAYNIAGSLGDSGRPGEALVVTQDGIDAMQAVLALGPDDGIEKRLVVLLGEKALVLQKLGRPAEAVAASQEGVTLRERRLAALPGDWQRQRDLAVILKSHADLLQSAGRGAEACAAARRSLEQWRAIDRRGLGARDARADLPQAQDLAVKLCR